MASAAPLPPSAASKNALAQFVLEGYDKGYVRRSTAAAPATPTLMVDLIVRIAGVPAGCRILQRRRHIAWHYLMRSPAFAVCPCVPPACD